MLTEDEAPGSRLPGPTDGRLGRRARPRSRQHGVRHVSIRSGVVLSPDEGRAEAPHPAVQAVRRRAAGQRQAGLSVDSPGRRGGGDPLPDRERRRQTARSTWSRPRRSTFAQFGVTLARVLGRPYWLPVPGVCAARRAGRGRVDGSRRPAGARPRSCWTSGFRFSYPTAEAALTGLVSTRTGSRCG